MVILKTKNIEVQTSKLPKMNLPTKDSPGETKGFAKRFPKVQDRVLSILKNDEYAREKDWYLTIMYWAKCGYIDIIIPKEKLLRITSPESITRARRKLTQDARETKDPKLAFLLKDTELQQRREDLQEEMRDYFKR